MFQRTREPFGKAGVIVGVIALVAALAGGAYAANGLNGKQKNEVKKIAKQFAGKKGARGPAGPAGAPGAKGDAGLAGAKGENGAPGADGADGADGESVEISPLTVGDVNCDEGGAKFSNEQGEEAFACNGLGTEGGGEMKGFWQIEGESSLTVTGLAVTSVTFPAELDAPPAVKMVYPDSSPADLEDCPGTVDSPEATAGFFCLYPLVTGMSLTFSDPKTYGVLLAFGGTDETYGSWAVKGL